MDIDSFLFSLSPDSVLRAGRDLWVDAVDRRLEAARWEVEVSACDFQSASVDWL